MSGRGTNKTPWRTSGALMLPGSPSCAHSYAAKLPVRQQQAKVEPESDSAALNMDAIADELAKRQRLVNERRQCTGEGCKTLLSQYNRAKLCSVCRRKAKIQQPDTLKSLDHCACGRSLLDTSKCCRACLIDKMKAIVEQKQTEVSA